MKKNNFSFSIIDNVPFKRTIEYACSIGVNNSRTSVVFDYAINVNCNGIRYTATNNLTTAVNDIVGLINSKANHLVYDKLDDLTDDDKFFIGFMYAVSSYRTNILNEFVIKALKKATIEFIISVISVEDNFNYVGNIVTIKDIIFDRNIIRKVTEEAIYAKHK